MKNFVLFNDYHYIRNKLSFYLDKMRTSNLDQIGYKTFNDYIKICDWMIRRQEYNFTIDTFEDYEKKFDYKLKVLDIGCGVVPLCNYISNKGHEVYAIDPIKSDIVFLNDYNLNKLYSSDVKYMHSYGEILPFEDNSFDVVYSVSVLEHIPMGNDKVVLSEAMRVLKQDGLLIITTDVTPSNGKEDREYAAAFTYDSIKYIFNFLDKNANINKDKKNILLEKLKELTWNDVYNFWIKTQNVDVRDDIKREYLAVGFYCLKTQYFEMSEKEKIKLMINGQDSLTRGYYYYQTISQQREEAIVEKEQAIENLTKSLNEKENAIKEFTDSLNKKEEAIVEKEQAIENLTKSLNEKENIIQELDFFIKNNSKDLK